MTVPDGVDYEAMDDEPSSLLFMIAAPNDGDVHLEVLSRLMTLLMDEDFRARLLAAKDKDEFLGIIDEMEKDKDKFPDEASEKPAERTDGAIRVLAVTACPTGIAHTYMAAVMIGGMVPPIAIALSTTFFKNRWTEEERKSGPVNYIMGLSFITEGAIPYAASDPIRVIPACMVGAGLAGGLSMAFNCTLMAPHGGIFVFAVVGNWPMHLVALAAGSVVSMLLLTLLKKKKTVKTDK